MPLCVHSGHVESLLIQERPPSNTLAPLTPLSRALRLSWVWVWCPTPRCPEKHAHTPRWATCRTLNLRQRPCSAGCNTVTPPWHPRPCPGGPASAAARGPELWPHQAHWSLGAESAPAWTHHTSTCTCRVQGWLPRCAPRVPQSASHWGKAAVPP